MVEEELSAEDRKALENIQKYGCHILKIVAEDNLPPFAYSIGIDAERNQPDLIVVGLDLDLSQSIINNYNSRLKAGETFEPGKFYSDFLGGFDVAFVEVSEGNREEYLGWGCWLYSGTEFRALQLVYPTTKGEWPWDANANADYLSWQPILNETGFIENPDA